MKTTTTIRAARHRDFRPLIRLVKAYYRFDSIAFDERGTGRALSKLMRDKSLGRIWVIDTGRALAGYLILTYNYDLEFGGMEGMITDLYLASRYRGKGLGARMIAAVREFCRREKIRAIELQVSRDNRAARSFYRALGFKSLDRIVMSTEVERQSESERGEGQP
jgi:ribosomal protein S18 acetylase RimI-like enzyme